MSTGLWLSRRRRNQQTTQSMIPSDYNHEAFVQTQIDDDISKAPLFLQEYLRRHFEKIRGNERVEDSFADMMTGIFIIQDRKHDLSHDYLGKYESLISINDLNKLFDAVHDIRVSLSSNTVSQDFETPEPPRESTIYDVLCTIA